MNLMKIKLIFTGKGFPLILVLKVRVLELGNGPFFSKLLVSYYSNRTMSILQHE